MEAEFVRKLCDGQAGLPGLLEAIEQHLENRRVPAAAAMSLMVAFDEILSNVLHHGGAGAPPAVTVSLAIAEGQVTAEVADAGRPFDPLVVAAPDTSLPVEDRPIGGLGIHLVRELMDSVAYVRDDGVNRLRFSKTYSLG